MKKRVFTMIATLLGALEVAVVSTASWAYFHQEDAPSELMILTKRVFCETFGC